MTQPKPENRAADGAITVTLSRPIEAHGETLRELRLEDVGIGALDDVRIKMGDYGIDIHLGDVHKVVAAMAGIPRSSARRIPIKDIKVLLPEVLDFLDISLPTGER